LTSALYLETTTGSPFYQASTQLPPSFDPVAQGWILAPGCDFDSNGDCGTSDLTLMFQAGNLVTGVATSASTEKFDLVDDGTLDAADLSEWLVQAATDNGHGSAYLRGDTDLDRDVDLTDYNRLAANFDPNGIRAPHFWDNANSDGDADIDLSDYNALTANFNAIGYGTVPVPEPTATLLAVLGLMLASVPGRFNRLR
jgi:hypothetical protein